MGGKIPQKRRGFLYRKESPKRLNYVRFTVSRRNLKLLIIATVLGDRLITTDSLAQTISDVKSVPSLGFIFNNERRVFFIEETCFFFSKGRFDYNYIDPFDAAIQCYSYYEKHEWQCKPRTPDQLRYWDEESWEKFQDALERKDNEFIMDNYNYLVDYLTFL